MNKQSLNIKSTTDEIKEPISSPVVNQQPQVKQAPKPSLDFSSGSARLIHK